MRRCALASDRSIFDAAAERRSRLAEAMDDDVASGPVHMAPPPPVGIEFLVEQQIKAAVSRCV